MIVFWNSNLGLSRSLRSKDDRGGISKKWQQTLPNLPWGNINKNKKKVINALVSNRVDMVRTNHNKDLILWRHMPMGQFHAHIFSIPLTSNYFWASEVFKNEGVLKVNYFHSPIHLANELWNFGSVSIRKLIWIPDNMI